MTVSIKSVGSVVIVTIDNPPVNALGAAGREALIEVARRLNSDPAVDAVVLAGAGRLFVGGADIKEFDTPPQAPHLPEVLAAIETSAKPWVAAIHGVALGGGLELALACHYRLARPGTKFGLPEVTLGLIPGAGGTQRLPRLIGVEAAIPIVTENKHLTVEEAVDTGLVDGLIGMDMMLDATAFAAAKADVWLPCPLPKRPVSATPAFWEAAEARLRKSSKGNPAPLEALAAMRLGIEQGGAAGLAFEREVFLRLRMSEEASALRYLFFAERAALRPSDLRGFPVREVSQVGIVGGGLMGAGIATSFLKAGLRVTLLEQNAVSLKTAKERVYGLIEAEMKRGRATADEVADRKNRFQGATSIQELAQCDLVIEAVFEDLDAKRGVFAKLGRICHPEAILATNTSYLDPRKIAQDMLLPERFLGLHFFSPAHLMKLVEVVPMDVTSPETLATAFDIARRLQKIPVKVGICEGFVGNRILQRYRLAAEDLIVQGVDYSEIDAAMRGFGFAMGPFEMQDMAGLEISWLQREAARAKGQAVPTHFGDLLIGAGRKGQKSGGGWYDYAPSRRAPIVSPEARQVIAPLVTGTRRCTHTEISDMLVRVMAAEGQAILDEGIAATPADIDLVKVHGYGFPRVKGGPMFWAGRRPSC